VEEQLDVTVDDAQQQVTRATAVLDGTPSVDHVTVLPVGVHEQTNGGPR
jgi:hypothetical protein